MLEDGNTFIYGYIGSRATGSDAGDYMVVGPGWKGEVPAGIKKVFHSSTQFSLVAYRTQLFNPEDMPNVVKIQSGYGVKPLSEFLGQPAPAPAQKIDFPKFSKEMVKTKFFDYLEFSFRLAPAGPEEKEIRAKLAKIGVGPDKTFDLDDLSPEQKKAVAAGMKAGETKIAEYLKTELIDLNGWEISSYFGDRAFYNGDWLKRAAGAQAGIYGNESIEAAYPITRTLADGSPLDGSKSNYTITFPANGFPPVNAFWSVTMYGNSAMPANDGQRRLQRQIFNTLVETRRHHNRALAEQKLLLTRSLIGPEDPDRGAGDATFRG